MRSLRDYIEEKLNEGLIPEEEQLVNYYYKWLSKLNFCHPLRIVEVSTGLYDGQHRLAYDLMFELLKDVDKNKKINKTIRFTKKELEQTHHINIFFDEIIITYSNMKHLGGCTFKDGILRIYINNDEVTKFQTVCSTISHELKHAWQDYKTDFSNNAPSKIAKTKQYRDIVKNLSNENLNANVAANYAYHIINVERDAFTSEFSSELKILIKKKKPKSINECIDLAKEINIFNDICIYKEIYEAVNKNGHFNRIIFKEDLLEELSKIKNKKYTWKEFYYNFIRKLEKFHDKMCNIIALLYFEYAGPEKKKEIVKDETEGMIY